MGTGFERETLTLAQARQTFAWKKLNAQQLMFMVTWAESGGDIFAAFNAAYASPEPDPKKAKSAATRYKSAYAVAARKTIKEAMAAFLQKTPREIFLEDLNRILHSKKPNPSKVRALEIRAQIEFGVNLKSLKAKNVGGESAKPAAAPLAEFERTKKYAVGEKAIFKNRVIVITGVDPESSLASDYEYADGAQ